MAFGVLAGGTKVKNVKGYSARDRQSLERPAFRFHGYSFTKVICDDRKIDIETFVDDRPSSERNHVISLGGKLEDRNVQPSSEHDPTELLPADFSPKDRPYIHFDKPQTLTDLKLSDFDPVKVSVHEFMPFVEFTIKERRYDVLRDENGRALKDENNKRRVKFRIKSREIKYASHADSLLFSYYAFILAAFYENELTRLGLSDCVLAYRTGRGSNIAHAKKAFDWIRTNKCCTALAIDITSFFDNLDHKRLKIAWKKVIGHDHLPDDHYHVFKNITRYASASKRDLEIALNRKIDGRKQVRICDTYELRTKVRTYRIGGERVIKKNLSETGIPQGSPISGLLANVYLLDYDRIANSYVSSVGGLYMRYSDDICVLLPSSIDADAVLLSLKQLMMQFKLEIKKEKTEVSYFHESPDGLLCSDRPFQYLGFTFDGQKTLIRNSSLNRFYAKMNGAVKAHVVTADKFGLLRHQKYQRSLYKRYTHLGKGRNFIKYAYKAARILNAPEIRHQLRNHRRSLERRLQSFGAK